MNNKMRKIIAIVSIIILGGGIGFYRDASADPSEKIYSAPDTEGADKIVWRCDEGKTEVVMYRAIDQTKFLHFTIAFTKNSLFALYHTTDDATHWLIGVSQENMKEVEPAEWINALREASPNYYRLLRRKLNDCVQK